MGALLFFFFSSRRRHTRYWRDWSSDVCSSDLALQTEIVTAQAATVGERRRWCAACGQMLASKGHYRATFRSLFGAVPVRVRRLLACPCGGPGEPKSFATLDLGGAVAPELAYVTARYAALAPFGKVAALLSELLPVGGARNAGTVRNRTRRVGEAVVQPHSAEAATRLAAEAAGPVVVGLDGGHLRSRHPEEGRHFEVIAGKVIGARGVQHRLDRKSVVQGKSADLGGRRILKKKKTPLSARTLL